MTALALIYFIPVLLNSQNLCVKDYTTVTIGAQQFDQYIPYLKGKKVAVLTNHTGQVNGTSIVDTLLKLKIDIKKIFGPEHGFRGNTEAGVKVNSQKDIKTGLPVISLYGSNKKPTKEQLQGIDILVYDIQDVGVRFYTYISTMCYAMEACAENGIEMLVLDRPNPNGFYVDGPVMQQELISFLGLHPVPVVYGMTCGEYAKMANDEGWLKSGVTCKLKIIPCINYDRNCTYSLPVNPSPNLPDLASILLYPAIGLFEGVNMSVGRGTASPFKVIGHPQFPDTSFYFTPKPNKFSQTPLFVNQKCYGINLSNENYLLQHPKKIALHFLLIAYQKMNSADFFNKGFNAHAGSKDLKEQVLARKDENTIRESWEPSIDQFLSIRKKYLIYPDLN